MDFSMQLRVGSSQWKKQKWDAEDPFLWVFVKKYLTNRNPCDESCVSDRISCPFMMIDRACLLPAGGAGGFSLKIECIFSQILWGILIVFWEYNVFWRIQEGRIRQMYRARILMYSHVFWDTYRIQQNTWLKYMYSTHYRDTLTIHKEYCIDTCILKGNSKYVEILQNTFTNTCIPVAQR